MNARSRVRVSSLAAALAHEDEDQREAARSLRLLSKVVAGARNRRYLQLWRVAA